MPGRRTELLSESTPTGREKESGGPKRVVLSEGTPVLIQGHTENTSLNGLMGRVESYVLESKLHVVVLKDGRKLALHAAHLKPLASEDDNAEERIFTQEELSHLDRRTLNLQQSDLSRAKRVHHLSLDGRTQHKPAGRGASLDPEGRRVATVDLARREATEDLQLRDTGNAGEVV